MNLLANNKDREIQKDVELISVAVLAILGVAAMLFIFSILYRSVVFYGFHDVDGRVHQHVEKVFSSLPGKPDQLLNLYLYGEIEACIDRNDSPIPPPTQSSNGRVWPSWSVFDFRSGYRGDGRAHYPRLFGGLCFVRQHVVRSGQAARSSIQTWGWCRVDEAGKKGVDCSPINGPHYRDALRKV